MADPAVKTKKERRRYGSYLWVDPKTGRQYTRVRIPRTDGSLKYIYEPADNPTHAKQGGERILTEYDKRGTAFLDGRSMTFFQLAEWYKEEYVVAPLYVDDIKIEGMRTWVTERNKIDRIVKFLGDELIREIDETVLRNYRRRRLAQKKVKITTINRDFETIKAMLRKAKKKKWITEVPEFDDFILKSHEQRRTVTLSREQEASIMNSALSLKKVRLYAVIIALRDTGARPNELYPVNDKTDYSQAIFYEPIRWRDVFDDDGMFRDFTRLVSYKGKARQERIAIISERMKVALDMLWQELVRLAQRNGRYPTLNDLVFPVTSFKKSWDIVRRNVGMPDLRLRDLRRDWVTRLARLGYSDKLAQHGAGQSQMQTSFEYTVFDLAAAQQAKQLIDTDNAYAK